MNALLKGNEMKELIEISYYDKQNTYKGGIEVVGKDKANALIAEILSLADENVLYCTIEVKGVLNESL